MDTAFRLYGEHRVLFFGLGLLAAVPGAVGWLAVDAIAAAVRIPPVVPRASEPWGAGEPLPLVSWALFGAVALGLATLTSTLGTAASAVALLRVARGAPATLGGTVAGLARTLGSLTLASLGVAAAAIAGLGLGVAPGLVLLAGTVFVGPVLVLEGGHPLAAARRSWLLTRGRRLELAAILGLCAVVLASTTGGLIAVASVTGVLGGGLAGVVVDAVLTQAVAAAGAPVLYLAMALSYFGARVEIEGLDVLVVTGGTPASRGPGWSP